MKRLIAFLFCVILLFGVSSNMVKASNDLVLGKTMTAYSRTWIIKLPDSESPTSNPDDLCLNLLASYAPSNGTNLTRAVCTYNPTQYFKRLYATVNGTTYRAWAPSTGTSYSMNCRRLDSTGSYVNVVQISTNPRGDLNIHSPSCIGGSGSYFLAAPPRSYQSIHGGGMVVWKTSESTGYTNNRYLVWRANEGAGSASSAHSFYQNANTLNYEMNNPYSPSWCIHS